jgi:SAM-dependent methyltransferase
VVALDDDPAQVERARRTCAGLRNVAAVRGDFLSVDLGHEPFDVVTALASLHHLPFAPAVARIQELLRPGGRLLVLGVWEDRATRRDRALNQVAALTNKVHQWAWGPDRMDAPATEPEMTLAQVRHDVSRRLPGASVRRHLLWRYTLAWQKPSPS